MPLQQDSDYRGDASLQELIFIGHLYCNPDKFESYASVLNDLNMFTQHPAKEIWAETIAYWREYGKLPETEEIQRQVIDEKSWPVFSNAIEYNLGNAEDKARFICDEFIKTIKVTLIRNNMSAMDFQLNSGNIDLNAALALQEKLSVDISRLDTAGTDTGLMTASNILSKWAHGSLITQQDLLPIGIPGLEKYVPGVPRQQLNIIAAHAGGGKTTSLCQITSSMLEHENVLYVTLEMPAPNILFKIIAARTADNDGVDPNLAFWRPDSDNVTRAAIDAMCNFSDGDGAGRLFFLDMPANSISAINIKAEIRRIKRQYGVRIGVVMIDYADHLRTSQGSTISDEGFSYMIPVMADCMALCKDEGVVGWTASQTGKGLSDATKDPKTFKPVLSKDLWGSDSKMQVANLELGLAVYRLPDNSRWGIGALSKLKDRFSFGKGESLFVVEMDYKKSRMKVIDRADENTVWSDIISRFKGTVEQYAMQERMAQAKGMAQRYAEHSSSAGRQIPKPRAHGREVLGEGDGF